MQQRAAIGDLVKGWPFMAELNFVKKTNGCRLWHLENNKPEVGICLNFIEWRNPSILGESFAIAPFTEIPLREIERSSRLILRLAWGLAYVDKCFDPETNHKNIVIGSHFDAFVQFKWFWQFRLSDKLRIEPGIALTHISNGRFKVPNLGLNLISANLGMNYILAPDVCKPKTDTNHVPPSKHEVMFWYSFGLQETGNPNGTKYQAHTVSVNYYYNRRNTHKFGAGADIFYEQLYVRDLNDNGYPPKTALDQIRIGPKLCYAYNIGRISLPFEWGMYVGAKTSPEGIFFHRLGVRYVGPKGMVVVFGLKTHFGVAYHFDIGAGYRLPVAKKKNAQS
ncbi:MAG: acyloxyacyl hydrolase [Bacteroidia bacterium]